MGESRPISGHGHVNDRAFLFSILQKKNTILFESSRHDLTNDRNFLFHSPVDILTTDALEDIPLIFQKIESYLSHGKWIAGYVGYECGYHFENIVQAYEHRSTFPLLRLGVYDRPLTVAGDLLEIDPPPSKTAVTNVHFQIDEERYGKKIGSIKEYILNGDTYQVNFTDRVTFDIGGDEVELYFLLREKQHVPFGAFLNLGEKIILSFSPELFFRRSGGQITCKPMKGTSRRGRTLDEDAALSQWLQTDGKNRSENLMIVDLLRNDIGRICESGSVTVTDLFHIEKYDTVLQMTSTVNGILKNNISYYDIFSSLFPCGSVTGAPKIRTMKIIHELEQHRRGVYCGAIGFIAPEGDAVFNVAIRTIESDEGKGSMGVGSGIVFDSDPLKEYEECSLKAKFLFLERPRFQLLETILWDAGFTFFEGHVRRLKNSAEYFSFPFDEIKVNSTLRSLEESFSPENRYRVRLLLGKDDRPYAEASILQPDESQPVVKIAAERTDPSDLFYFHKTTHRSLYDRYSKMAKDENIADYIFLNVRGETTEGSINNIFIEKNGYLYTPPLSCGVLRGIFRENIIATNSSASEKILSTDDVRHADALYICNSVRGWRKVTLSE